MRGDLTGRGDKSTMRTRAAWPAGVMVLAGAMLLARPGIARAGKLSWLDDVVHEVVVEAQASGKGLVRGAGGDGARAEVRRAGRLFRSHDAEEGLGHLVRQSEELARAGRRADRPAEALLQSRFSRLLRQDPQ